MVLEFVRFSDGLNGILVLRCNTCSGVFSEANLWPDLLPGVIKLMEGTARPGGGVVTDARLILDGIGDVGVDPTGVVGLPVMADLYFSLVFVLFRGNDKI